MKNIKEKIDKLEEKLGVNKKKLIVIHQIDKNTLKYRNKLYEIPQGLSVSEYLKKKFAGKKIILDNIYA